MKPKVTHQDGDGDFLGPLVSAAKAKGKAVYIGDGANRWPAGNRADAAVLYRLALEKGEAGAAYHAVDEEGVSTRGIANAIGKRLSLPVEPLAQEEAMAHFGWLGMLAGVYMPASSRITQEKLDRVLGGGVASKLAVAVISGEAGIDQAAMSGKLTREVSLNVAMVSRLK